MLISTVLWITYGYVLALNMSEETLTSILEADGSAYLDLASPTSLLSQLLRPRVPGTENHTLAREAIIEAFGKMVDVSGRPKWHVETIPFEAQTPLGPINMTNIVVTRDRYAPRKLVLAAHYDSKYYPKEAPEYGFIGATDSAFPCALLVDIAMALDVHLDNYTQHQAMAREAWEPLADDTTLQFLFLDGEEAFEKWSRQDSVYGARHLASLWAETWDEPAWDAAHVPRHTVGRAAPVRRIQTMNHFVLLDLLGTAQPLVPYYFPMTRHLHEQLQHIEARLVDANRLWEPGSRHPRIFQPYQGPLSIDDDHTPFLEQGVPILHLIPWPFPKEWHTIHDNAEALDPLTMQAWSKLMRVFTAEYLGFA